MNPSLMRTSTSSIHTSPTGRKMKCSPDESVLENFLIKQLEENQQ